MIIELKPHTIHMRDTIEWFDMRTKVFLDKDVYKTLANKRSWFNQKSF